MAYAGFSGIEVVAWCLMDNHFHLLLHVPSKERVDPGALPEKEVLRRLRLIYQGAALADIERVLGMCPEAESRRRYLERFTKRMWDLAMFMRSLKQRFSRWYNGRNRRKGTLWEDRYRSVAVEIQDLAESSDKRELPPQPSGRRGVAMRFGQWGGLRVLRDLRVGVVG